MINKFNLLRNVGQFDSVQSGAAIPLTRLTLVYAENGRGKTTLASVLRSLGTNNPLPVHERKRLGSQYDPHLVLECAGSPANVTFQNGAWSRSIPEITVFDDLFVNENVYSGLVVEAGHRQNLHELILGAQGVTLNATLQAHVAAIEQHNARLRTKGDAIPASVRGTLTPEQFCALGARPDIDQEIQDTERNLLAAKQQEPIRVAPIFERVSLPEFDVGAIKALLARTIDDLDVEAAARVQEHIATLPSRGESWIGQGMTLLSEVPASDACPFCAQALDGSNIIGHYRAYFSDGYAALKRDLETTQAEVTRVHGGGAGSAFERSIRALVERRTFWKDFCDLPEVSLDTAKISLSWQSARDVVLSRLTAKKASPLEPVVLSDEDINLLEAYSNQVQVVRQLAIEFEAANAKVALVKEQAAAGSVSAITADLARLQAVRARYTPNISALCDAYLAEVAAKAATERLRAQARAALDQYRTTIFPTYETAINEYLRRFNAGYRLQSLTSQNTRGGSSCTFSVVINAVAVPASSTAGTPGAPSFRNTLSAGDRNTLALAFFFASLDQDPTRADRIVVIDDPMTSLDEHRTLTTVQEIRQLAGQVKQVIVLSHTKPFLCSIWQGADSAMRSAMIVTREANGSGLAVWDVSADAETEYDRNHRLLREYIGGTGDRRLVAEAIRRVLEGYLRVAETEHYQAGTLLGRFINEKVRPRIGRQDQIFDQTRTTELQSLVEYANQFHHDTNPAWVNQAINDGELHGYVSRTLAFVKS